MKKPYLSLLLLACSAALVAHAEKADRNKTAYVESDSMRIDDVKQITSFAGNVVLTKGTIIMRAANIVMHDEPDGYQVGVITGTPETPAFFRQKREGLDEYIEVESQCIDYYGRADIVKFTGKALFRRLRGTTLADEISGELMVYENLTDKFSVDGSSATADAAPKAGQRVHAMLTPKPEAAASASASASQPKASAPVPSPSLRATGTLGSVPQ